MTRNVSEYTACRVPLRRISFGDAFLVVHEGAVASIKRIEARWKAAGGNDAYRVRRDDTGAYNCRKTTSGRSWSKHSWGCAVDINWSTNPYSHALHTDMPRWFVQLWLDEGWGWGGNWSSVKDAMHFSKFTNEGGDGLLYVDEEPEDDMAQVPQEEWEQMKRDVATLLERTSIQVLKDGAKKDLGTDHVAKAHAKQQGWLKDDGTWDPE